MKWPMFLIIAAALDPSAVSAQPSPRASDGQDSYFITTMAERRLTQLPTDRPLYWRIETFKSPEDASAHQSDYALFATVDGQHWLFTLGPKDGTTPGAKKVAEIGPIPVPQAKTYLLRINHAGGPRGSQTPVHSHPGAEAIYVLNGQVTQQTRHGTEEAGAGSTLNAHEAEMVMQLKSTGARDLSQLVMFVVDADRPFSPSAKF